MSQNPYNNELISRSWLLNIEDQRSKFHLQSNAEQTQQWLADLPQSDAADFKLLEIGCGSGFLSHLPEMAGLRYTGLDESAWFIEHCEKHRVAPQHRFLQADLLSYTSEESYGAAIAVMVWCTFRDPLPGLLKLHSLLGPGSRALLTMPNPSQKKLWIKSFEQQVDEKTFSYRYGHAELGFQSLQIFLHSHFDMVEAFNRAGFSVKKQMDFGYPPASDAAVYTAFDIIRT